jgi:hypothetical protein
VPEQTAESFKSHVIDSFRASVPGRAAPLDYGSYLALPPPQRSGDEMPVVDTRFTPAVLAWLGFDGTAGEWTYNRTRPGQVKTRPDFEVHGPVGPAFIWEDKATVEEYGPKWEAQLRKYMVGQAGYAVWSNARRILACDLTRWQDGVAPVGTWLLGGRAATRADGTRAARFWHARAATEAVWTYQNSPPADLVRPSLREGSLTNPASASPAVKSQA